MGVGRGVKIGDVKESVISRKLSGKMLGNRRRPKKWYSKTFHAEVMKLSEIFANNETSTATVIFNGEKANATLKQLEAEARKLNAELRQLNINSKDFGEKEKEFQKVDGRLKDLRGEINQTGGAFSKLADQANKYQQVLQMITVGLIGLGAAAVGIIKGNAKLEDSLADIRKTTKLTVDKVKKLNTELGKIDTRTSRSDLREMAVVAGQLGISQKDILPFVDSIDKLNVALGAEIQGGASTVATQMGTLRNILTDMKTSAVSDDMLRLADCKAPFFKHCLPGYSQKH